MPMRSKSSILKNEGSSLCFFMSKPKYSTRHMFISDKVGKLIGDYNELKRDNQEAKFIKREMLPPLTAAYRLNRDIRTVTSLHAKLKKRLAECEVGEVERQKLLEDVIGKCERMKATFRDSELAYHQLQEELNKHEEILNQEAKEENLHDLTMKHYLRAGECLMDLWQIMEDAIVNNKIYYDFIDRISDGDGIGTIVSRFERNATIIKDLNQRLNETLEKAEMMKTELIKEIEEWEQDLVLDIEKLQAMHHGLYSTNARNAKYEQVLNNISIVSAAQQLDLNKMLKSIEQMIENLIERKVIGKSYRKTTLARQIDAIRADYVKKKAIIHEYEKAKVAMKRKKSHRLQLYTKFSDAILVSDTQKSRLKDLYEKKKMKMVQKARSQYMKSRRGLPPVSSSEVWNPLLDLSKNTFNVTSSSRRMSTSSDSAEESSEELELFKYGIGTEIISVLNDEPEDARSPSRESEFSRPSLGLSFAPMKNGSTVGSQNSTQSIDVWGKLQSFSAWKR